MNLLLSKTIEKKILENYIEYQSLFVEFQSKFLTGLYSRYKNLENGNLVLYYAREAHLGVLRRKDHDLNCNLSYKRFWENYNEVELKRHSIIKIAEDTSLPKETARRKILQLTKNKMLNKKNKIVGWIPSEQYKEHYVKLIVVNKKDLYEFDKFVDRLLDADAHDVKIVEDFSDLDASNVSDDIVENTEDTMTLLDRYVDELNLTLDKTRLKNTMKALYNEAQDLEL